jgi:hypothetical protein
MDQAESDLAQIWQTAVEEYEQRTKKKLTLAPFRNMEQVMKGTEGLEKGFKDWRHDQSKTDKVRSAFKNNLWLIQKVVTTVQMVGNAASVSVLISLIGPVEL